MESDKTFDPAVARWLRGQRRQHHGVKDEAGGAMMKTNRPIAAVVCRHSSASDQPIDIAVRLRAAIGPPQSWRTQLEHLADEALDELEAARQRITELERETGES